MHYLDRKVDEIGVDQDMVRWAQGFVEVEEQRRGLLGSASSWGTGSGDIRERDAACKGNDSVIIDSHMSNFINFLLLSQLLLPVGVLVLHSDVLVGVDHSLHFRELARLLGLSLPEETTREAR